MQNCPPAAAAAPADHAPSDFDPDVLASLPMVADGSMPGFALEMLAMFESTSRQTLWAIDTALAAGDRVTLLRHLHSLKSSCAQIGALALSALAGRYEHRLRSGDDPQADWRSALHAVHARALAAAQAARSAFAPPQGTP